MRSNKKLLVHSSFLSIIVHVFFAGILFFSFELTSKPQKPQKTINNIKAVAVNSKLVEQELKRLEEQEKIKQESDLKRHNEIKKQVAKLEEKRKTEEKKINDLKKQKKLEEELRKKTLELKKKKEEQERKKKIEAQKKKEEKERKKKIEVQKKKEEAKRKALEKQLQEQLEKEQQELNRRAQKQELEKIRKYANLYKSIIESNFNKLSLPESLSCNIRIELSKEGEVINASIIKSSGHDLFDTRAERAVYSASPLPVPDDNKVFEKLRFIEIEFEP